MTKINKIVLYLPQTGMDVDKDEIPESAVEEGNIEVDSENLERNDFITINNIKLLKISTGGDWELPLDGVIYYDGTTYHSYYPISANVYNPIHMSACGNNEDDEIFEKVSEKCDIKIYDNFHEELEQVFVPVHIQNVIDCMSTVLLRDLAEIVGSFLYQS